MLSVLCTFTDSVSPLLIQMCHSKFMKTLQMDVDAVFRVIGELGRQQLVYIAYLLMLNIFAAFHMIQVLHTDACSTCVMF